MKGYESGAQSAGERPPPKTLITPALFSRPLATPLTGRRGRKARKLQPGPLGALASRRPANFVFRRPDIVSP